MNNEALTSARLAVLSAAVILLLPCRMAVANDLDGVIAALRKLAKPENMIDSADDPDDFRGQMTGVLNEFDTMWHKASGIDVIPDIARSTANGEEPGIAMGFLFLIDERPEWMSKKEREVLRFHCEELIRLKRATPATYGLLGHSIAHNPKAVTALLEQIPRENDDDHLHGMADALLTVVSSTLGRALGYEALRDAMLQNAHHHPERDIKIQLWLLGATADLLNNFGRAALDMEKRGETIPEEFVLKLLTIYEAYGEPIPERVMSRILSISKTRPPREFWRAHISGLPESLLPRFRPLLLRWISEGRENIPSEHHRHRMRIEEEILRALIRTGNPDDLDVFRGYLKELPIHEMGNTVRVFELMSQFGTEEDLRLLQDRHAAAVNWAREAGAQGTRALNYDIRAMERLLQEFEKRLSPP
jgi:hypothetical protein